MKVSFEFFLKVRQVNDLIKFLLTFNLKIEENHRVKQKIS